MSNILKNKFFVLALVVFSVFMILAVSGGRVFAQEGSTTTAGTPPPSEAGAGQVEATTGQGGRANPADIANAAQNFVVVKAVSAVGYLFGVVASVVFYLGGALVDFALGLNQKIFSDQNAVVMTGWAIVKNFANLGFILFIIIIAFATIFRMQSYGLKKTLWRLIVAALLVNFSLVIAGAFINFFDIISKFFLDRATLSGPGSFSTVLAQALGVQAFLKMSEGSGMSGLLTGFGSGIVTFATSILFVAGFTLIGGLTLLAVATMFLVRYFVLSILLILSPGALLMWILPGTQHLWKKWWNKFIDWVIFAPIVLFFLYLTVVSMQGMEALALRTTAQNIGAQAAANNAPLTFGLDVIGNFAIILGLMMGGLIYGKSLSGSGASIFYGWAKKTGDWAKARGKRFGRDITDRARTIGRKTDASGNTTTGLQRMGSTLAGVKAFNKIPGIRGAAQGLGGAVAKAGVVKPRAEEIEKYRKENLEALTKDAIKIMAENPTLFTDPIKAAAVAKQAAKKGVDFDDDKVWQKLLENVERLGTAGDIYSARPDLAGTRINAKHKKDAEDDLKRQKLPVSDKAIEELARNKAIEGAVRGIKIENITNLRANVIDYDSKSTDAKKNTLTEDKIRVVLSLSAGHLAKLGSSDDTAGQRENIERILQELEKNKSRIPEHLQNNFEKLKKYVNKSPNYQSLSESSSERAEEDEDIEFPG